MDSPQPTDLYVIGTLAVVHKVVKMPNQSLFVFAEGLERVQPAGIHAALAVHAGDGGDGAGGVPAKSAEEEALQRNVLTLFQQIVAGSPTLSDELSTVAMNIEEPGRLVDFVASSLPSLSTPRQAGDAGDHRRPLAAGQDQPAPGQGAGGPAAAQQDPVRSAGPGAADAARVLPARADEGDPEGTGRAGRDHARRRGSEAEDRAGRHAGRGQEGSAEGAEPAAAHVAHGGRLLGDAQLHRVAGGAAVGQIQRRRKSISSRPRRSWTTTTTTWRRSRTASWTTFRCAG